MLRALLPGTLICALALGACGGTAEVRRGGALQVGLIEYRLHPTKARVHTGALWIEVHNDGRLAHNLAVTSGARTLAVTPPIAPGAVRWLELGLAPGRYTLASTLFSDRDLGLYGTLLVVR